MFAITLLIYAVRGSSFLPTDYVHSIAGQCDNVLTLILLTFSGVSLSRKERGKIWKFPLVRHAKLVSASQLIIPSSSLRYRIFLKVSFISSLRTVVKQSDSGNYANFLKFLNKIQTIFNIFIHQL